MKRLACLLLLLIVCLIPAYAASPADLTPEQAAKELRLLKRALVELHPGLYRYQTAAQLDDEFARAQQEVAQGASPATMYRLASRISASVRCGHTWTNPLNQGERLRGVLDALPVLPLSVRVVERRLLVTASTAPAVQAFDEVLSIDGRLFAPGQHVNAVGSNALHRREIDLEAVRRCDRIVVDSVEVARRECGDLLPAVDAGLVHWNNVTELGAVLEGSRPGRTSDRDLTLFESQGMGMQDIYVGKHVLDEAQRRGLGQALPIG